MLNPPKLFFWVPKTHLQSGPATALPFPVQKTSRGVALCAKNRRLLRCLCVAELQWGVASIEQAVGVGSTRRSIPIVAICTENEKKCASGPDEALDE